MDLVTIIVPIYNSSVYLDGLFKNLTAQTFSNIEIICVDDGSTDSSAEIIKKYAQKDNRIKYVYQANQGGGAARNTGIAIANGDYIICLDSDDIFEKDLIEKLYNKANTTNSDITICQFKQINLETNKISRHKGINKKYLPQKEVFCAKDTDSIFEITNPVPWNKLYKTEFIKRNNLKYTHSKRSNDIAFYIIALAIADRVTIVPEELITYRYMSIISGTKNRGLFASDCIKIYQSIYKELCERNVFDYIKQSYIKVISSSIVYELSFPIDSHTIKVFKDFLNEKPFNDISKSELKKIFKIKSIKRKYFKYSLLKILTLGLNKSVLREQQNCEIVFINIKNMGLERY